jgi:hypothetical protein
LKRSLALLLILWLLGILLPQEALASFTKPASALPSDIAGKCSYPTFESTWPQASISLDLRELAPKPHNGLFCGNDPVGNHDPIGLSPELYNSDSISDVARINSVGQPEVLYGDFNDFWSWLTQSRTYSWQKPNDWDLQRLFSKDESGAYSLNTDPASRLAVERQQRAVAFRMIRPTVERGLRDLSIGTVAGVSAVYTGGASFGLLSEYAETGYALAGSSMLAGAVGDLTAQGGENLAGDRNGYSFGQTLNSTAISLGLGMTGYGISQAFSQITAEAGASSLGLLPQPNGPGAKLLSEYRRFRSQGFTAAQARYLTKPYSGMGHHFIPRRTPLPEAIVESPANIMGMGMSRGRFYERHFMADPYFYGTRFPKRVGGTWNGMSVGLSKPIRPINWWYAAPDWVRATGIGGGVAAGGAYWYFSTEPK